MTAQEINTASLWFGIVGSLASIISLTWNVVQLLGNQDLKRTLRSTVVATESTCDDISAKVTTALSGHAAYRESLLASIKTAADTTKRHLAETRQQYFPH